jgi:hypothetical protein
MEAEVLANATEEDIQRIKDKIIEKSKIDREIKAVTSAFYCELCDKQYTKIAQYENHLSSYDHNHKKVLNFSFVPITTSVYLVQYLNAPFISFFLSIPTKVLFYFIFNIAFQRHEG